jgi:hypothetical protein
MVFRDPFFWAKSTVLARKNGSLEDPTISQYLENEKYDLRDSDVC